MLFLRASEQTRCPTDFALNRLLAIARKVNHSLKASEKVLAVCRWSAAWGLLTLAKCARNDDDDRLTLAKRMNGRQRKREVCRRFHRHCAFHALGQQQVACRSISGQPHGSECVRSVVFASVSLCVGASRRPQGATIFVQLFVRSLVANCRRRRQWKVRPANYRRLDLSVGRRFGATLKWRCLTLGPSDLGVVVVVGSNRVHTKA